MDLHASPARNRRGAAQASLSHELGRMHWVLAKQHRRELDGVRELPGPAGPIGSQAEAPRPSEVPISANACDSRNRALPAGE